MIPAPRRPRAWGSPPAAERRRLGIMTEPELIEAIDAARQAAGLNQTQVADRAGTRQADVSRYLSMDRPTSTAMLIRLAGAVGLELTLTRPRKGKR